MWFMEPSYLFKWIPFHVYLWQRQETKICFVISHYNNELILYCNGRLAGLATSFENNLTNLEKSMITSNVDIMTKLLVTVQDLSRGQIISKT